MRTTRLASAFVALLFGVGIAVAATEDFTKDQPGSADHPALKRIAGSTIVFFEKQAFNEQCVALEKVVFDYDAQKFLPFKQEIVEGPQTRILYRAPKNASTLEVLRQYQADLKAQGYENLFEGKGGSESTLDNGYDRFLNQVYKSHGIPVNVYGVLQLNKDYRYAALRKASGAGKTYVTIFAAANETYDHTFGTENRDGQVLALVTITEQKGMADRMVKVSAAEMETSLSKSGRIALYGIYFDFNKADVKPDSAEALAEIDTLMKSDPALKVLIVGHTDSIGGFEMNKTLSQRRAEAVVAALTTTYGIAAQRLFPVGVSFAAPVESNETEEGRAKNRRVELVKIVEK